MKHLTQLYMKIPSVWKSYGQQQNAIDRIGNNGRKRSDYRRGSNHVMLAI